MASAYKCDRCGNYFDSVSDEKGIIFTVNELSINSLLDTKQYELCLCCQSQIKRFIKGGDLDELPVMSSEDQSC
jgi:hypothetical protein